MGIAPPESGSQLGRLLLGDVACATVASCAVAPAVAIIDRTVVHSVSTSTGMLASFFSLAGGAAARPRAFLRSPEFLMIWAVYAATYITANFADTLCERFDIDPVAPKFLSTTVVNMSACCMKDAAFAKMFGTAAARAVPLLSFLMFMVRDSLTIVAAFTCVAPFAAFLAANTGLGEGARTLAQLLAPMLVQVVSTPLHLLGLDLYNNPTALVSQRIAGISDRYVGAMAMRQARALPAFGLGGIGNTVLRNQWRRSARQSATKTA